MRRLLNLLLLGGLLSGCQAAQPIAVSSGNSGSHTSDKQMLNRVIDLDHSGDSQNALASLDREFLPDQIAESCRGSQVGICDESGGRYTGTVLRCSADSVELMNCIRQEAITGPGGEQQCKTSHIPFQTFPTSSVTHFVVISPPAPNFPSSDDDIDGSVYSVAEIVNRSGHRHRWGKAPSLATP